MKFKIPNKNNNIIAEFFEGTFRGNKSPYYNTVAIMVNNTCVVVLIDFNTNTLDWSYALKKYLQTKYELDTNYIDQLYKRILSNKVFL